MDHPGAASVTTTHNLSITSSLPARSLWTFGIPPLGPSIPTVNGRAHLFWMHGHHGGQLLLRTRPGTYLFSSAGRSGSYETVTFSKIPSHIGPPLSLAYWPPITPSLMTMLLHPPGTLSLRSSTKTTPGHISMALHRMHVVGGCYTIPL